MGAIEVIIYITDAGKKPFEDWFNKHERNTQLVIDKRITRIKAGNLGDCKPIQGSNIWEIRIDYGPGIRIYFAKQGSTVVVLLVGGDKGSQSRDIAKAEKCWLNYRDLTTPRLRQTSRGKKHG